MGTHLSPTLLSKKLNGSPSPHHTSSMLTRGPGWQSQVEDTIDEDGETNSSIVLTYRPKYGIISRMKPNSEGSLTTLRSCSHILVDENCVNNGNIPSASTRFSDV